MARSLAAPDRDTVATRTRTRGFVTMTLVERSLPLALPLPWAPRDSVDIMHYHTCTMHVQRCDRPVCACVCSAATLFHDSVATSTRALLTAHTDTDTHTPMACPLTGPPHALRNCCIGKCQYLHCIATHPYASPMMTVATVIRTTRSQTRGTQLTQFGTDNCHMRKSAYCWCSDDVDKGMRRWYCRCYGLGWALGLGLGGIVVAMV